MRSIRSISHPFFVLFAILSNRRFVGCNPITNSNLNDHIREFSSKEHNVNSTRIKTMQKEDPARYPHFTPDRYPVRFEDTSDSASSSNSRGLLSLEHAGSSIHGYEGSPHISYGYEYYEPDSDHPHHGFNHHPPDHYHGHHHVDYHHRHYDHALAAKAFLWPIAGIALLGAAAALVSNPVLLQLGVVSGKRKRRDTEETFEPELDAELNWMKKKHEKPFDQISDASRKLAKGHGNELSDKSTFTHPGTYNVNKKLKSIAPVKMYSNGKSLQKLQSPIDDNPVDNKRRFSRSKELNESKLVPVPLIILKN